MQSKRLRVDVVDRAVQSPVPVKAGAGGDAPSMFGY